MLLGTFLFFQEAMVQFEWHDGTVKNMHVDLPLLQSYQVNISSKDSSVPHYLITFLLSFSYPLSLSVSEAAPGGRACVGGQGHVVKQYQQQADLGNSV